MTGKIIQTMQDAQITVRLLSSHTSDNFQPCDVSIFGHLRQYVNASVLYAIYRDWKDVVVYSKVNCIIV